MQFSTDKNFALAADREDPLKSFRSQFCIPKRGGKELVYFCGNSLGLEPKNVEKFIARELKTWQDKAVEGHFSGKNPWVDYHKFLRPLIAQIAGATEKEVVVANSLTVNLHLLLTTFYRPKGKKKKILVEHLPFSSDWYAFEAHAKLHGYDPKDIIEEIKPKPGSYYLSTEKIIETIEKQEGEIALIVLGGINYLTGQAFDLSAIALAARKRNILFGLDLAHAIGNIPLKLHDWEVDFAVWCSYKYLNAGPGGVGGYFIHEKHATNSELPRLAGWWGNNEKTRFKMEKGFDPIPTAEGWQLSNAPVLSMAAQWSALEIFQKAGMEKVREKSIALTGYLEYLLNEHIINKGDNLNLKILTPKNPEARGCQLSLSIQKDALKAYKAISEAGFIVDYREPDIIRVAPTPLYNQFIEVFRFVNFLKAL